LRKKFIKNLDQSKATRGYVNLSYTCIRGTNSFTWPSKPDIILTSVADPGSGAFLTHGSGIRNGFFPDPGSRIPDLGSRILRPYFKELFGNFFGKKFDNSLKIGPNFFL
jgi:hypothetical protein